LRGSGGLVEIGCPAGTDAVADADGNRAGYCKIAFENMDSVDVAAAVGVAVEVVKTARSN
jgi:hypothetical protein